MAKPDFEELNHIIATVISSCWEGAARIDAQYRDMKVSCYWVGGILRIDVKGLTGHKDE